MTKMKSSGYGSVHGSAKAKHDAGETTAEKPTGSANKLAGAVKELYQQHPHNYDDLGPFHGTDEHVRHIPILGGMPEDPEKPVG